MSTPHWHVLGAGSLGSLWAVRLARAGEAVTLLLRDAAAVAGYAASGGVLQLEQDGNVDRQALPAEPLAAPAPIRYLILACKAYDAQAAITVLLPRLCEHAQVLLLQNGMGSQQAIAALLHTERPQARCVYVSSTEAAWRRRPWHTVFAGQGQNWLGVPGQASAPAWLARVSAAGIAVQWSEQIESRLWRKLALNCAINPLSVINDCPNGGLRAHANQVNPLCDELQRLLLACGQSEAAHGLHDAVWQVIEATAANYGSMHQDVQHGRRTEIDYLLGYACRAALANGVAVPSLQALYRQLRQRLEQRP